MGTMSNEPQSNPSIDQNLAEFHETRRDADLCQEEKAKIMAAKLREIKDMLAEGQSGAN